MRLHFKRRKVLRTAGIATVLTGAALLLSGCWGTVFVYSGGKTLVIARDNTRRPY
ncbi:MAG: hypothetical protein AABM43_13900 [Actinomycetota bacterium]